MSHRVINIGCVVQSAIILIIKYAYNKVRSIIINRVFFPSVMLYTSATNLKRGEGGFGNIG